MAHATPIIPGYTWELSRRCTERRLLLRPDPGISDAMLYSVALYAHKYGMAVHTLCIMQNHYHLGATDVLGTLPDFMRDVDAMMARCVKRVRGKDGREMEGPVWEADKSYGRLWLESDPAFIESFSYMLANPVAAGLVAYLDKYPGFVSAPEDMRGRTITVKRPKGLGGHYPDEVTLRFEVPPVFAEDAHAFVRAVRIRLDQRCAQAQEHIRKSGKGFWAQSRLRNVDPFSSPGTKPKSGTITPIFRASVAEAICRGKKKLRAWRHAYHRAFRAFRAGCHSVEWPAGTWWFARHAGARVAPCGTGPLYD